MARYVFNLPTVQATQTVRLDTALGSDSPASGLLAADGTAIGSTLTADHIGFLPEVQGPDGVSTLYVKVLAYGGAVTGTPVAVTGLSQQAAPSSPGGSSPAGAPVVRVFPFAYNTAGLVTGHTVYTPTPGDILLDAWVEVTQAWNGTTPTFDFGPFLTPGGGYYGTFEGHNNPDMSIADAASLGGSFRSAAASSYNTDLYMLALQTGGSDPLLRVVPGTLVTADPIKVCVSTTGATNGADPGATQGAAKLYLVTCTPATS